MSRSDKSCGQNEDSGPYLGGYPSRGRLFGAAVRAFRVTGWVGGTRSQPGCAAARVRAADWGAAPPGSGAGREEGARGPRPRRERGQPRAPGSGSGPARAPPGHSLIRASRVSGSIAGSIRHGPPPRHRPPPPAALAGTRQPRPRPVKGAVSSPRSRNGALECWAPSRRRRARPERQLLANPSPWWLAASRVGPAGGLAAPGVQAGKEAESLGVADGTIETPRDALTRSASRRYP